jgi:hypothetical protein
VHALTFVVAFAGLVAISGLAAAALRLRISPSCTPEYPRAAVTPPDSRAGATASSIDASPSSGVRILEFDITLPVDATERSD